MTARAVLTALLGGSGLLSPVAALALTCSLTWTPPATDTAGHSPVAIAGYRVYTSRVSLAYTPGQFVVDLPVSALPVPTAPQYRVPCAEADYFVVTAVSPGGLESAWSNEVQVALDAAPDAPGGLAVRCVADDPPPVPVPVRLPLSGTYASTQVGAAVASRTIDGTLSTWWAAAARGAWIRWKLREVGLVSAVQLAWRFGETRQYLFTLETSLDGTAWVPLLGQTASSGTTSAPELVPVPLTRALYLRLTTQGSTLNAETLLAEATVLGPAGGAPAP